MKKFENPVLDIKLFDIVKADTTSAYGQAAQALKEAGAQYIGEADWEENEDWSF